MGFPLLAIFDAQACARCDGKFMQDEHDRRDLRGFYKHNGLNERIG